MSPETLGEKVTRLRQEMQDATVRYQAAAAELYGVSTTPRPIQLAVARMSLERDTMQVFHQFNCTWGEARELSDWMAANIGACAVSNPNELIRQDGKP